MPYIGGTSALPILELRSENLQDNILVTVGDALTVILEEELAAESTANPNVARSTVTDRRAKSADAQGRTKDAAPPNLGA